MTRRVGITQAGYRQMVVIIQGRCYNRTEREEFKVLENNEVIGHGISYVVPRKRGF